MAQEFLHRSGVITVFLQMGNENPQTLSRQRHHHLDESSAAQHICLKNPCQPLILHKWEMAKSPDWMSDYCDQKILLSYSTLSQGSANRWLQSFIDFEKLVCYKPGRNSLRFILVHWKARSLLVQESSNSFRASLLLPEKRRSIIAGY